MRSLPIVIIPRAACKASEKDRRASSSATHARASRGRSHAARLRRAHPRCPRHRRSRRQALALAARPGARQDRRPNGRRCHSARQVPLARARAWRPADAPRHVGIAVVREGRGRARQARSLRSRHHARHLAPHRSAPLRRGRLVGRRPMPIRPRNCSPGSASSRSTRASTAPICTPRCARRRVAVKQALLGGAIVVGAGNIYACEALWEAQIDPRMRSDRISRPRAARPRRSDPCDAGARGRARRLDLAQLPQCRGRRGRVPAQGQGLRSCRQALLSLRHDGAPHRPGSARDVLLPRLPTALSSNAHRRVCETSATGCEEVFRHVSIRGS